MRTTKAVLIFFVCGLATGLCFSFVLSRPRFKTFWFLTNDIFLIPTYRYYIAVGAFLLLGFVTANLLLTTTGLAGDAVKSQWRRFGGMTVVGIAPFLSFIAADSLFPNVDAIMLYMLGIVLFVLLISIACWIATAKLYYPGLLLNFLTFPVALAVLYVVARIDVSGRWSGLISYPTFFSLFSASCGFWMSTAAADRIQ